MPNLPECDPANMIERYFFKKALVKITPVETNKWLEHCSTIHTKLEKVARKTGAIVIDPAMHLCPNQHCTILSPDGYPAYKDSGHLHPDFVRDHVHYIDKVM